MKCFNCGTEYNGNYCPRCGAMRFNPMSNPQNAQKPVLSPQHQREQHKRRKKQVILGIVIAVLAFIFLRMPLLFVLRHAENVLDNASRRVESIQNNMDYSNSSIKTEIEYTVCDISEMLDELDTNALRAETKYTDMYIQISGTLGTIDSDGKYICLEPINDDWLSWDNIQCDIISKEQIDQVLKVDQGDTLTIKGQITSIGEVLGYTMEIHEIIIE